MSPKRIFLAVFVILMALMLVNTAVATSVTMKYIGPHNGHFFLSIDGRKTLTPLMCDSFDNQIHQGETWNATELPLLAGISKGMFGSAMTMDYKAAGLIYKSMLSGTLSTVQAQWAVWGLFSSNARNTHQFAYLGGAGIDAAYVAMAQTAPNGAYAGLLLFTPVGGKAGSGPQEFIGYNCKTTVPEPGTLTLLGTGLIGLAAAARRKFAKP